MQVPTVVLASGSPRRRELLAGLGVRFVVDVPDVDERPLVGEDPAAMVLRLARAKAAAVAARHRGADAALVIAADTTVVIDGEMLGKPNDEAEAAAFVARLSGRTHEVHTGHALRRGEREVAELRTTRVRFRALDADEMRAYAATGEGLDKAGGYAIQGRGAALVDAIDGCYGTVVGLSLPLVVVAARTLGVRLA
ncbi:MAG: Maf family protein [Trueperaceae bacterium]|nr:Maf family protein [Trueperaceae bacterium]